MIAILDILARNWWAIALRGVFAILFGITAFIWPGITLAALVLLFGAYTLVDGAFALAAVLVGRNEGMPWWALLLQGIIGISVGIITMIWPGITALVLLTMITAWSLLTGILEIIMAIKLRKVLEGEWLLALSGALSVLFGIVLLLNPGAGAIALLWLIASYVIIFGLLLVALGFKLRSWAHGSPMPTN